MELNLDVSLFSVICELNTCLYAAETELEDMKLDQIINDIRSGQLENVRAVVEFNPVEGWCTDLTAEVLDAVRNSGDLFETPEVAEDDPSNYTSERIDARRAGVAVQVAA